ncbi:MAG: hypothetical protein ABNH38_18345 [Tateyamaria sp.]|jgi:hypothetical protein|uniref:hypothetical protein n=1 Tax=Tateyamaria sp. TaxID=1929288 RepID=UPI0032DC528F
MKFLKAIAVIVGILVLIGVIDGDDERDRTTVTARSESEQPKRPQADCEQGTAVSGTFYTQSSDIDFRTGPGSDHAPVINRKATEALGKTRYRTLWPTMVLEGRCETADWLKARIVKSDGNAVNWETGWVHKQFVTAEVSDEMKAGLLWSIDSESEFTDAERQLVRRGALKVLRDEPNCAEIITGYRSGSRKSAYYVTCNAKNGGPPFNVWFTPNEVEAGGTLAVPEAYSETQSRQACERAIKAQVSHPSTLDVHHVLGYASEVHHNGNRTVVQEFSAENSFGLELEHRARCLLQPDGTLEITITEFR